MLLLLWSLLVLGINMCWSGNIDFFLNPPVEMVVSITCNCRINMTLWVDTSMLTGYFERQRVERNLILCVHAAVKKTASQASTHLLLETWSNAL